MRNVVFVMPFVTERALGFASGAANVHGARLGIVSEEPADKLPPSLRDRLAGHWQVQNAFDPRQIADGIQGIARRMGPIERVLGMLEQLQEPLAEVQAMLGLPGMSPEVARNFRDKAVMKAIFESKGVPCARHRLVHRPEEALDFISEVGLPVVVKPPDGAGSANTFRLETPGDLDAYLARMQAERDPVLFEEFLRGEEHSLDAVTVNGRMVWYSISKYWPSPLTVMENPWMQWCVLSPRHVDVPAYEQIRETGERAVRALGLTTGLTHMEWFQRPDGSVAVSEIGARPPGAHFMTLFSHAHDVDFYAAWAKLKVFDTFEVPPRKYAVGAAYLRGAGTGRVKAVHGIAEANAEFGSLVVEARLPTPGQQQGNAYDGAGFVMLRHEDTEIVARALKRAVEILRVELA
jgi:hypothetical protein